MLLPLPFGTNDRLLCTSHSPAVLPEVESAPEDVIIGVDSVAVFVCSLRGKPEVSITWWTKGVQLQSNADLGIAITTSSLDNYVTQSQLTLEAPTVGNSGTYLCTGSSDIGTVAANATLTVESMSTNSMQCNIAKYTDCINCLSPS